MFLPTTPSRIYMIKPEPAIQESYTALCLELCSAANEASQEFVVGVTFVCKIYSSPLKELLYTVEQYGEKVTIRVMQIFAKLPAILARGQSHLYQNSNMTC